ncbi:MAG: efflux RND transporter periplasmic adaptor subunit, partial [Bacteroidetes bacterium]|nr:efflux RND transporter periplasmic adaptor subunit [Bacteroidota bacterium]
MKKKLIYISSAVIIIIVVLYFFVFRSSSEEIKYRTEKISKGDIVVQVRATGTVNAVKTVLVGSQVSGTIAQIYVDFNSIVKAGQIIAQIDPTFLAASVKESEANLERVQAQVNEAKRNLNRFRELFSKALVSQAEMDAAQTNYETSIAQLKQAEASLDRARVNLRYATIKAPIDGVVISRDIDVGQTVAASLQAPKLFVIANDLKKMQVEANVDEADIGNIQIGQEVTFTVDAHSGKEFKGTVTQIRLAPQTVQNVVTYTVIIEVPNPDLKLMPCMTATVSILIDEKEDVLRVPALALRFQPPPAVIEKIEKELQEKMKKNLQDTSKTSSDTTGQQRRRELGRRFAEGGGPGGPGMGGFPSGGFPRGNGQERGGQQGDGQDDERRRSVQRVWLIDSTGNLKPAPVRTGLSDNRYVEVKGGFLKEGDEIVIGMEMPSTGGPQAQQTNPFAPRTTTGPGT